VTPRLLTIPFSHYCEKARWALDWAGVDYVEDAYLPGLHFSATKRVGGSSVPVLVTSDRVLSDSAQIVAYADDAAPRARKLYPDDPEERRQVAEIEAISNDKMGVATRVLAYHYMLGTPSRLLDAVRPGLTPWQARSFGVVMRLLRPLIRKRYRVGEAGATWALETVRRTFHDLGERLGPREWLVGDHLTAADITFASLASLVLAPAEHPKLTTVEAADGAWRAILDEMRATPAGKHALRVYRDARARV
jgi:glutathione S-transferase